MESHLDSFSVEEALEEESDVIATFVDFRDVDSVGEEVVRRKLKDASEHEVFREENAAHNMKMSNMFNIQDCIKTPTCTAAQRCDELLFRFLYPLPPSPLPVVVAATLVDPDPSLSQPFSPDINLAYQLSQTKSMIIALKQKCFLNFCPLLFGFFFQKICPGACTSSIFPILTGPRVCDVISRSEESLWNVTSSGMISDRNKMNPVLRMRTLQHSATYKRS